jgi:hypothetical protein
MGLPSPTVNSGLGGGRPAGADDNEPATGEPAAFDSVAG